MAGSSAAPLVPLAPRSDVRVDEQVTRFVVLSDSTFPPGFQNRLLHLGRRQTDHAKVDRVTERMLAVGRDVVTFFAQHLVELGTAKPGDQLDAGAGISQGDLPQELEKAR